MAGTPSTAAARGYSWAPFAPGHEVNTRHGAYSPRKVDPLATEIIEATRPGVTWWRDADEPAIQAWGRVEARIQLMSEWLAEHGGDLTAEGSVRPAAAELTRLEVRAESMRSRLGLDPTSRARLGRDVAAQSLDLARLWAAQEAQDAEEAAKREANGSKSGADGPPPPEPAQDPERGDDEAA